ncbi:MAG: HAD family hydrolase [Leptospirales bacterium]|nr:HAD family hydrolase [Leptospirales bacterium]
MTSNIYLAFDIDGTIYDAGDILEASFREGVMSFIEGGFGKSLHTPTKDEIIATLGFTLDDIFITLFPLLTKDDRIRLSLICTDNLVNMIRAKKGRLIDGVYDTLKKLHAMNFNMLVASNGARDYVEAILETYNIKRFFSEPFIYTGGNINNKTDIIGRYIELNPERRLIMIGDRATDLNAAKENNIPFIGCAFGHAGDDEIKGERYIIRSFIEIIDILERSLLPGRYTEF